MSMLGRAITLLLLFVLVVPLAMTGGADKLPNRTKGQKNWCWVARRHKDDNSNPHIAYVVKIAPQTAQPSKLEAALWAYDRVEQPDGAGTEWRYVKAEGYPITLPEKGSIDNGTGDLLRRERGVFQLTEDGKVHTLGVSLNQRAVNVKGKANGKSKNRPHERVVMRYTIRPEHAAKNADFHPDCPDVPEDDVLEEEEVADPDAGLDYPDP